MDIELYVDKNYAQTPGTIADDAKLIRVRAKVTGPGGAGVAGIDVSFALSPRKESYHFYHGNLAPAAETDGVPVIVTDATGVATLYIVSDAPGYAVIFASLYGGTSSPSHELYFGSVDGSALQPKWLSPSLLTNAKRPIVAQTTLPFTAGVAGGVIIPPDSDTFEQAMGETPVTERTFPVSIPLQSPEVPEADQVAFLVVNDLAAIPCQPIGTDKVAISYSDIVLDPATDGNAIAYFVQNKDGTIGQSPATRFRGLGIYQNQPDPGQVLAQWARSAPAPQVTPDPGRSGIITIDTLKSNYGLRVSIPSFDIELLDDDDDIQELSCAVYFYMNGFYEGTDDVRPGRMYPVSVGNLEIVGTTVSAFDATLDWPYAYGWAKPQNGTPSNFYCEYILKDQFDRLYISNTCSMQTGSPWQLDTAGEV